MSMCLQRQYYSVFLPLSFIFYPWRKNFAQRYNKKKRYANKSAKKWKKHYLVCVVNFRLLSTIGVGWFSLFLFAVFLPSFCRLFTVFLPWLKALGIFVDLGVSERWLYSLEGKDRKRIFGWICRNRIFFFAKHLFSSKKIFNFAAET